MLLLNKIFASTWLPTPHAHMDLCAQIRSACAFSVASNGQLVPKFLLFITFAVPSCKPPPSLLGSEVSGDHSMKTRDAGGTCMGAHAAAPHQREYTCCVVGGSVNFIVSCSIIARPRISIPKTIPFANILKWNARPCIRKKCYLS